MKATDLEVLRNGRPYLRGILAFLGYLRFGASSHFTMDDHYKNADCFIDRLKEDIEKGSK